LENEPAFQNGTEGLETVVELARIPVTNIARFPVALCLGSGRKKNVFLLRHDPDASGGDHDVCCIASALLWWMISILFIELFWMFCETVRETTLAFSHASKV
jgi:hypothetical protein